MSIGGSDGKESACNAGDPGSLPGKIPWRRKWQPTPVFLPGKSHGQRSLLGFSPWCCKESDTTDPTFVYSKETSKEEGCFSIASDQVFWLETKSQFSPCNKDFCFFLCFEKCILLAPNNLLFSFKVGLCWSSHSFDRSCVHPAVFTTDDVWASVWVLRDS